MKFMTEDSELFLVDTNIFIYAFEKEDNTKKSKSRNLLDECFSGIREFAISNQNLAEFASVSTKKGKLSIEDAKNFVVKATQFQGFKKISYRAETIPLALEFMHQFKTSFWDSLLAATMRENGIFNIYTENINDFKMPWIKAVNPLK